MSQGKIGFLLHPGERPAIDEALATAKRCGFATWTALEHADSVTAREADGTVLLITVGGDGTFLYGARLAAPRGIPVMGVNRGRLGFLNDVELSGITQAIEQFAQQRFRTQRRSLIEARIAAGGEVRTALALNEILVRSRDASVARLRVEADEEVLGLFDADGVVVATATGSTAYALSAGGPPVDPRLHALVVVPLAPHAVISRPVVIPDEVRVQVTVVHGRVFIAADGISVVNAEDGGEVAIHPGPDLEVVRFADSPSFHDRLRQKFRFGVPHKDPVEQLPGAERGQRDAS